MRVTALPRFTTRLLALALGLALPACADRLLVDPAAAPPAALALAIDRGPSLSAAAAGTALQQELWVRVSAAQASVVLETVVPLAPAQQEVRLGVPVDSHQEARTFLVAVELRVGGEPALRGQTTVQLSAGEVNQVVVSTTPVVSRLEVSPGSTEIPVGATSMLHAVAWTALGDSVAARSVSWSSSDVAVATVSDGVVTGHSPGSATITATSGELSARATVTVTRPPLGSLVITPSSATLAPGDQVKLSVVAQDVSGNPVDVPVVAWSTSDNGVATVDSDGVVTAAAEGHAAITATVEGISATASITVAEEPAGVEGVWYMDTYDGQPLPVVIDHTGGWTDYMNSYVLTLHADGRWEAVVSVSSISQTTGETLTGETSGSGTYTIDGNTLTMVDENGAATLSTLSQSGDTLTMQEDDGEAIHTYVFRRQ